MIVVIAQFDGFQLVLNWISESLLTPTIIALILLQAWVLVLLGGFLREWTRRRAVVRAHKEILGLTEHRGFAAEAIWLRMASAPPSWARRLARSRPWAAVSPVWLEERLIGIEAEMSEAIQFLNALTRVAPMLGLLGTLIPMGPALNGLASGSAQSLTENLVTAFTTTVLGVFCSVLTYGMGAARRAWYARDLDEIEILGNRLIADWRESKNEAKPTQEESAVGARG